MACPGQRLLLDIPTTPPDTGTNMVLSSLFVNLIMTYSQRQRVVGRLRLAAVPGLLYAGYMLITCLSQVALKHIVMERGF